MARQRIGLDTAMGGEGQEFPSTQWSMLRALADRGHPEWGERIESLARLYWKPVYRHIRARWRLSNEEAKDLTQEFFVRMIEGSILERTGEIESRFRTFLRVCLENFLKNQHRDAKREKRGGGRVIVPIDADPDEGGFAVVAPDATPDEILDAEWRAVLMNRAIEELREAFAAEGRGDAFEVFRRYKMPEPGEERPTHADVAAALGLTPSQVHERLKESRRRLFAILRRLVSESVSDEAALESEMRFLLGG